LEYTDKELDRAVTSKAQIRLVLETFRDKLPTEIFPGRTTVPKTLIFCKDDAHAEEVVTTIREVFGKGNDFAAKITYTARDPKGHLQAFRTSASLRVAVTVDMIATGTDVKPLECVFFMRDVRSASYFEQMKGRGARTIPDADFQAVTPDAASKLRFVIVDAVGVTEHDFVDPPLNRDKSVSLKKLLEKAAALELQLTDSERAELDEVAGMPMRHLVRDLVDAVDPDTQAQVLADAIDPEMAIQELLDTAVKPLASNPELRQRILELRATHDRTIDEISPDVLLDAHGVVDTARARSIVESWQQYLIDHRDEITAIQLMQEAKERRVSFAEIQALADRISRPPHNWTPDLIWSAYEAIEVGRVRHSDQHTLTDLVSLIRFATKLDDELVPYTEQVHQRYAGWLAQQSQAGVTFSAVERWWLDKMVEVIAVSAGISPGDLDNAPFTERGGVDGAIRDLGPRAATLIDLLNTNLTA
jgi:type I restriction enzyme R subunit